MKTTTSDRFENTPGRKSPIKKVLLLSLTLVMGSVVVPSIAQASYTLTNTYTVNAGPNVVRVTPDGAYAYVINAVAGNVSRITVATELVETITVGASPAKLAISPDGLYVYVTNNGDGTVTRISNANLSTTVISGVCSAPTNIAITPNGTRAYIGCGNSLGVINLTARTALAEIPVPLGSWFLAIDNTGTYVYTGGYDAKITQVQISDGTVVKDFRMFLFGIAMGIDPNGGYLYMLNANGDVVKSAIPALSSYTNATLGGYLNNNMTVDPSGLYGYVGTGSGVNKFNLTTLTSLGTAVSESSVDVAISADGSALFTVNSSTNEVKRFSMSAAPGAPTIGTATASTPTSASISFTAPVSDGGSTILSYTATSTPGSFTGQVTQAGSGSITVTGLTASTAYTFTVTATSSIGTSSASSASVSITMPSSDEELAAEAAAAAAAQEAAAIAERKAAEAKREAQRVEARKSIVKNFGDTVASALTLFASAEIAGVTEKNITAIYKDVTALPVGDRTESAILKVARKFAILDQISTQEKFPQITGLNLVECGLVIKTNQSTVIQALRITSITQRDTYEEIQSVIAAEVQKALDRKARLALIKAYLLAL